MVPGQGRSDAPARTRAPPALSTTLVFSRIDRRGGSWSVREETRGGCGARGSETADLGPAARAGGRDYLEAGRRRPEPAARNADATDKRRRVGVEADAGIGAVDGEGADVGSAAGANPR